MYGMASTVQKCFVSFVFVAGFLGVLATDVRALELGKVETVFSSEIAVSTQNKALVSTRVTFENVGEISTALTTYDLFIGAVLPDEVAVTHGDASLPFEIIEGNGVVIRITMDDTLLSVGDMYDVSVSYNVDAFMSDVSGVYAADLPLFRRSDATRIESMSVTYPETFGPLQYVSASFTDSSENGFTTLVFTQLEEVEQLLVTVGEKKTYSFMMERQLENVEEGYVKRQVLIPPHTQGQQVVISSISPFPSDVAHTADGNDILVFDVGPQDTIWVRIQGFLVESVDRQNGYVLPTDDRTYFLATDDPLWAIADEGVLGDIAELDEGSLTDKIPAIYGYVVDELSLDTQFRQRHSSDYRRGAETSLRSYKTSSVEDFADVFVAVCRSLNIPARVVSGYVYPYAVVSQPLGMFHVWPQYWSDTQGWVSVDPAYEEYAGLPMNDMVGLNRVIVGVSYDPVVWGTFADTTSEIIPTDQEVIPFTRVSVNVEMDETLVAGTAGSGTLIIQNEGNAILYRVSFLPNETSDLHVDFMTSGIRSTILPGEEVRYEFSIEPLEWYVSGTRTLSFVVAAEALSETVRKNVDTVFDVEPLWWVEPVSWVITVVAFVLFLGTMWSGSKIWSKIHTALKKQPEVPVLKIEKGETPS